MKLPYAQFSQAAIEEKRYHVFHRTWWAIAPGGGRIAKPGHKTTIARNVTIAEARRLCARYNEENEPGDLSRKAEFTEE